MSKYPEQAANQGGRPLVRITAILDASSGAVQSILQQDASFSVDLHTASQCATLPLQAGQPPDLILLEPPSSDQDRLMAWLRTLRMTAPDVPVLVIGERLSVNAVQALMALPASNVVPLPFSQNDLLGLISTVMRRHTNTGPTSAQCLSFMSAVGGAGATTLAIETAYQLQSMSPAAKRVALIDLNFIDGACASYLDVPANLRLEEVAADPERIDEALIDAFASPHGSGIDVLAAARSPFGYRCINAQSIARLLDVSCSIYDHVVIDISRWMQDWTLDVLAGSDAAIIVSELTVPALHGARDLALNIETENPNTVGNLHLVLNRMSKRVFGHSISLPEAQKALGRNAIGSITSDWDGAVGAVNYGTAVGQANPKSRISKDIRTLIHTLEAKADDHTTMEHLQVAP